MKTDKSLSSNVRVISSSVLSPHSKALYEVGKNILSGSIESGRDFCKTMTANCAGAIPIYIGILVFLLPADFALGIKAGITFALPCIGYLIAMILFTIGYMPYSSSLSLDMVEEILRWIRLFRVEKGVK